MANTPQAKKRIRRNANRETINHSRISRIRTFIKAVESAIARARRPTPPRRSKRPSRRLFRGVARGVIHKNTVVAEDFAPVETGCVARLKSRPRGTLERAVGKPVARFISGPLKKCSVSRDSRLG